MSRAVEAAPVPQTPLVAPDINLVDENSFVEISYPVHFSKSVELEPVPYTNFDLSGGVEVAPVPPLVLPDKSTSTQSACTPYVEAR